MHSMQMHGRARWTICCWPESSGTCMKCNLVVGRFCATVVVVLVVSVSSVWRSRLHVKPSFTPTPPPAVTGQHVCERGARFGVDLEPATGEP